MNDAAAASFPAKTRAPCPTKATAAHLVPATIPFRNSSAVSPHPTHSAAGHHHHRPHGSRETSPKCTSCRSAIIFSSCSHQARTSPASSSPSSSCSSGSRPHSHLRSSSSRTPAFPSPPSSNSPFRSPSLARSSISVFLDRELPCPSAISGGPQGWENPTSSSPSPSANSAVCHLQLPTPRPSSFRRHFPHRLHRSRQHPPVATSSSSPLQPSCPASPSSTTAHHPVVIIIDVLSPASSSSSSFRQARIFPGELTAHVFHLQQQPAPEHINSSLFVFGCPHSSPFGATLSSLPTSSCITAAVRTISPVISMPSALRLRQFQGWIGEADHAAAFLFHT